MTSAHEFFLTHAERQSPELPPAPRGPQTLSKHIPKRFKKVKRSALRALTSCGSFFSSSQSLRFFTCLGPRIHALWVSSIEDPNLISHTCQMSYSLSQDAEPLSSESMTLDNCCVSTAMLATRPWQISLKEPCSWHLEVWAVDMLHVSFVEADVAPLYSSSEKHLTVVGI